jgi:hypothetical protein
MSYVITARNIYLLASKSRVGYQPCIGADPS